MSSNPGGNPYVAGGAGGRAGGGRVWTSDEYLSDDDKVSRSYLLAARILFIPCELFRLK